MGFRSCSHINKSSVAGRVWPEVPRRSTRLPSGQRRIYFKSEGRIWLADEEDHSDHPPKTHPYRPEDDQRDQRPLVLSQNFFVESQPPRAEKEKNSWFEYLYGAGFLLNLVVAIASGASGGLDKVFGYWFFGNFIVFVVLISTALAAGIIDCLIRVLLVRKVTVTSVELLLQDTWRGLEKVKSSQSIPVRDLKRILCVENITIWEDTGKKVGRSSYALTAVLADDREVELLSRLSHLEDVLYLEQRINTQIKRKSGEDLRRVVYDVPRSSEGAPCGC